MREYAERSVEVEKTPSSEIDLHFMRHGDKYKKEDNQSDYDVDLTAKGRGQAMEGEGAKDIRQAVAFGSGRRRAAHTAGLRMASNQSEITGNESLEELKQKLDTELTGQEDEARRAVSKIAIDSRLDFPEAEGSAYIAEAYKAYEEKRLLKYIIEKSDQRAKELGDTESFRYSTSASNMAKIMQKYLQIAPRFDQLVEKGNYKQKMERFLGSHQTIPESFLAKYLELTKGIAERDRFVKILGDQGFDLAEGFKVQIKSFAEQDPIVRITYRKEKDGEVFEIDDDISPEILNQIAELTV